MNTELHNFKKPEGGRGRPSPSALCAICDVIYTEHPKIPKEVRRVAAKALKEVKKPKPRSVPLVHAKPSAYFSKENRLSREAEVAPSLPLSAAEIQEKIIVDEAAAQEKLARVERVMAIMKDHWITAEMAKDPHNNSRDYWDQRYEEECSADW